MSKLLKQPIQGPAYMGVLQMAFGDRHKDRQSSAAKRGGCRAQAIRDRELGAERDMIWNVCVLALPHSSLRILCDFPKKMKNDRCLIASLLRPSKALGQGV